MWLNLVRLLLLLAHIFLLLLPIAQTNPFKLFQQSHWAAGIDSHSWFFCWRNFLIYLICSVHFLLILFWNFLWWFIFETLKPEVVISVGYLDNVARRSCGIWTRQTGARADTDGPGADGVKHGLRGIAVMARSTSRSAEDGDPCVSASTERGEVRELSLEEVLKSYEQPINEEQAWAVCYQCCSGLRVPRPLPGRVRRVKDASSILLHRDGTVSLKNEPRHDGKTAPNLPRSSFTQIKHGKVKT